MWTLLQSIECSEQLHQDCSYTFTEFLSVTRSEQLHQDCSYTFTEFLSVTRPIYYLQLTVSTNAV